MGEDWKLEVEGRRAQWSGVLDGEAFYTIYRKNVAHVLRHGGRIYEESVVFRDGKKWLVANSFHVLGLMDFMLVEVVPAQTYKGETWTYDDKREELQHGEMGDWTWLPYYLEGFRFRPFGTKQIEYVIPTDPGMKVIGLGKDIEILTIPVQDLGQLRFNVANNWDPANIAAIRQRIFDGEEIEPIEVSLDSKGPIFIIDGHHRALASVLDSEPIFAIETGDIGAAGAGVLHQMWETADDVRTRASREEWRSWDLDFGEKSEPFDATELIDDDKREQFIDKYEKDSKALDTQGYEHVKQANLMGEDIQVKFKHPKTPTAKRQVLDEIKSVITEQKTLISTKDEVEQKKEIKRYRKYWDGLASKGSPHKQIYVRGHLKAVRMLKINEDEFDLIHEFTLFNDIWLTFFQMLNDVTHPCTKRMLEKVRFKPPKKIDITIVFHNEPSVTGMGFARNGELTVYWYPYSIKNRDEPVRFLENAYVLAHEMVHALDGSFESDDFPLCVKGLIDCKYHLPMAECEIIDPAYGPTCHNYFEGVPDYGEMYPPDTNPHQPSRSAGRLAEEEIWEKFARAMPKMPNLILFGPTGSSVSFTVPGMEGALSKTGQTEGLGIGVLWPRQHLRGKLPIYNHDWPRVESILIDSQISYVPEKPVEDVRVIQTTTSLASLDEADRFITALVGIYGSEEYGNGESKNRRCQLYLNQYAVPYVQGHDMKYLWKKLQEAIPRVEGQFVGGAMIDFDVRPMAQTVTGSGWEDAVPWYSAIGVEAALLGDVVVYSWDMPRVLQIFEDYRLKVSDVHNWALLKHVHFYLQLTMDWDLAVKQVTGAMHEIFTHPDYQRVIPEGELDMKLSRVPGGQLHDYQTIEVQNPHTRKMFPVQDGPDITWEEAEKVYKGYGIVYPGSAAQQSLERLGQRGGWGINEVFIFSKVADGMSYSDAEDAWDVEMERLREIEVCKYCGHTGAVKSGSMGWRCGKCMAFLKQMHNPHTYQQKGFDPRDVLMEYTHKDEGLVPDAEGTPSNIRVRLITDRELPETRVKTPDDVVRLVADMQDYDREYIKVLLLDNQSGVVGIETVAIGAVDSAITKPSELFKSAMLANALAIIMVHNHPSGDPTMSRSDISFANRLKEVGELVGIELLDFLVVGKRHWKSIVMRSEGWTSNPHCIVYHNPRFNSPTDALDWDDFVAELAQVSSVELKHHDSNYIDFMPIAYKSVGDAPMYGISSITPATIAYGDIPVWDWDEERVQRIISSYWDKGIRYTGTHRHHPWQHFHFDMRVPYKAEFRDRLKPLVAMIEEIFSIEEYQREDPSFALRPSGAEAVAPFVGNPHKPEPNTLSGVAPMEIVDALEQTQAVRKKDEEFLHTWSNLALRRELDLRVKRGEYKREVKGWSKERKAEWDMLWSQKKVINQIRKATGVSELKAFDLFRRLASSYQDWQVIDWVGVGEPDKKKKYDADEYIRLLKKSIRDKYGIDVRTEAEHESDEKKMLMQFQEDSLTKAADEVIFDQLGEGRIERLLEPENIEVLCRLSLMDIAGPKLFLQSIATNVPFHKFLKGRELERSKSRRAARKPSMGIIQGFRKTLADISLPNLQDILRSGRFLDVALQTWQHRIIQEVVETRSEPLDADEMEFFKKSFEILADDELEDLLKWGRARGLKLEERARPAVQELLDDRRGVVRKPAEAVVPDEVEVVVKKEEPEPVVDDWKKSQLKQDLGARKPPTITEIKPRVAGHKRVISGSYRDPIVTKSAPPVKLDNPEVEGYLKLMHLRPGGQPVRSQPVGFKRMTWVIPVIDEDTGDTVKIMMGVPVSKWEHYRQLKVVDQRGRNQNVFVLKDEAEAYEPPKPTIQEVRAVINSAKRSVPIKEMPQPGPGGFDWKYMRDIGRKFRGWADTLRRLSDARQNSVQCYVITKDIHDFSTEVQGLLMNYNYIFKGIASKDEPDIEKLLTAKEVGKLRNHFDKILIENEITAKTCHWRFDELIAGNLKYSENEALIDDLLQRILEEKKLAEDIGLEISVPSKRPPLGRIISVDECISEKEIMQRPPGAKIPRGFSWKVYDRGVAHLIMFEVVRYRDACASENVVEAHSSTVELVRISESLIKLLKKDRSVRDFMDMKGDM